MKASDLLVKCLEEEGIEYIFGVPGEENADFMISLEQSGKIKFILTRHEQGAAFMAEIYGRLTGNPAGCLGTLGPGATNLITGVADSNMDRAPMLVLTGPGSDRSTTQGIAPDHGCGEHVQAGHQMGDDDTESRHHSGDRSQGRAHRTNRETRCGSH